MRPFGLELIYPGNCKTISCELPIEELRRRLDSLSKSLDNIIEEERLLTDITLDAEQSQKAQNSEKYKGLFLLLTSPEFLQHGTRDIQLGVGVCICKLLKIFCPQNPLCGISEEKSITKDVLTFLIDCIGLLSNLRSKSDTTYSKLRVMLYICAQTDVFMWCSVLGDESVLFKFIKMVFSIIKNLDVWSWTEVSVVHQMVLDMLVKVISDSEKFLSPDIVAFLLQFLIEPAKSTQPAQHAFSRDVIIRTADQLEYQIQMLLQNSLIVGKCSEEKIETKSKPVSSPENVLDDSATVDLDAFDSEDEEATPDPLGEHAFPIIYALHTIQNSIVAPVLPTIEIKLKSPIVRERKRSFRLLARLFAEPNSLLHRRNPNLWDAFLGRFNDIDSEVRKLCIYMLPQLLKQNQDLPQDQLLACFQQRIYDPDEDVRLLALRTMTTLSKQSESEISDDIFELLKERSRDKTLSIRKEASSALSSLYKGSLQSRYLSAAKSSSALNTVLHLYYQNSLDDKIIVERLLKSSIIPYHFENSIRVQALFRCYSLMDEASMKVMQEIFKTQYSALNLLRGVVKLLNNHNDSKIPPEVNTEIMDVIQRFSALIPKSERSVEHLKRFFNQVHKDKALRKYLLKMTKPQSTCVEATTALRDILKKIGAITGTENSANDNQINYARVVKVLLERCAPVLFDREFGKELINQLTIIKESGSSSENIVSINVTRSLCLLFAISVYFKEILPSGKVMDYLLGILSDENSFSDNCTVDENKSNSVTSDFDTDPYTLQEMALNILCCVLGGGPSGSLNKSESNDAIQKVSDEQSILNYTQLSERSDELLPILHRFCCTGITTNTQKSSQNKNVTEKSTKNNQRALRQGTKKPSLGLNAEEIAHMGLLWRRERRRSKLSVRVLFYLHNVVLHLIGSENKSEKVDLDSIKDHNKSSNDCLSAEMIRLVSLESKIKGTLDDIVQVCISCPVLSSDYITCLTSLSHIGLLFPDSYNHEIKRLITKSLVQVLASEPDDMSNPGHNGIQINSTTSNILAVQSKSGENTLSSWSPDGLLSVLTRAKICAIKLMTNWLTGLKNEVKPVVQVIIRLLYRIIIHDGDLTKQGKLSYGEMSRMRLVAATSWLKLARSQAYLECIEIEWYLSMSNVLCDPCPQVRSHFLTKLNQGLYKLRLPLEYMAIFALTASVQDLAFKQRAKKLLIANIQRRRDFLNKHPTYFRTAKILFALLPDYILPYVIYLLSHDSKWTKLNDSEMLNKIKSSLWFVMEPIISHGDNFSFLRRIIEKIKYARDALHPDDTISNEKLYTVCDISLGLLLSRCVNPTVKEYPVDVKLPKTLFIPTPADFRNPDFKQLMSMTMESKTDTSVDIVHSSMETPETSVRSKIQPVLQFTPKKACKEGLIPTELLKTKRAGISKTKTQAKACSQSEGIKKAKSESKSTKHDNELSGQESTDHSEVTMLENNKELEEVVDVVPTSISSGIDISSNNSPKDRNIDRNVFEENFSPPCVPSRRKKRPNKTTPENTKRLRTNKSPVFTPHENQSTLDCVVISKASSDKGPPQTNNTNLQPSNVSPRKIEKQLTKAVSKPRPPNSSKSSIQATKNRSNNIRCVKKDTHALPIPPSGDRKVSLRSINSKTAEGMEKLTIERTRNPQSAAKAPVRSSARNSVQLKSGVRTKRPPSRISAILAKQKLLSPTCSLSSSSTHI